jgi:hypothetical protein
MPYTGNKPSAVPLTSADIADGIITSAKIVDGTIVNADINASSAIALSKLSTTGTADATTFLRGDGAYTAVSSDYVLLASTDASSSASVSFDGYFSSTYKNYVINFSYMIPSTSSLPRIRYRRSNADVTASNYWIIANGLYGSSSVSDWNTLFGSNNDSNFIHSQNISTTASNGGITGSLMIYDPLNTTSYKTINFQFGSRDTNNWYTSAGSMQLRDATTAISGITFYYSSGNIASGNFKLYGIK